MLVSGSVYVFVYNINLFGTQTAWLWQTHAVKLAVDKLEDSQQWCVTVMPFGGKLPNLASHLRRKCYPNVKIVSLREVS